MKLKGHLLGFRSGKPWKMIVAVVYYVFCLVVLVTGMVTKPLVQAGAWDAVVFKLSVVVIFVWMLSPAVFLSETPLRRKLPLFKQRQPLKSVLGMMVVFLLCTYIFAMVESWHTPEYKTTLDTYNAQLYEEFYGGEAETTVISGQ